MTAGRSRIDGNERPEWIEMPPGSRAGRTLRATVYRPAFLDRSRATACVLFLHGMGESGVDGRAQLGVGLAPAIRRHPDRWPFVAVFPQKPTREDEWEDHEAPLVDMLDRITAEHGVDPRRVGITGLSQGGHGTWEFARRHSDRFALVAPISGYPAAPRRGWSDFDRKRDWTLDHARGAADGVAEALHAKPIWVAHGAGDPLVPVEYSDVVVEALHARGARPIYDRLPGVAHDSWTVTYAKPEYAAWFRHELRAR